jgi:plastocyanin
MRGETVSAILALVLLAGCAVQPESVVVLEQKTGELRLSGTEVVRIIGDGFVPRTLEVERGTEVVWVNLDRRDHTVSFSSIVMERYIPSGAQVSYVFKEPGAFEYTSRLNPRQRGHIIVK